MASDPHDPEAPDTRPTPSLAELRERARSLEAGQAERDALLVELARPVDPTEDARARADVLRLILDDPWLGGFSGSGGRRVDVAAAQALVDLGEPYASELSPESQALLALPTPLPAPPEERGLQEEHPGFLIACIVGLLELLWASIVPMPGLVGAVLLVVFSSFLPAFLPRGSKNITVRGTRFLGIVTLGLMGVPLLFVALAAFLYTYDPLSVLPLLLGSAHLLAAYRLSLDTSKKSSPVPPPPAA